MPTAPANRSFPAAFVLVLTLGCVIGCNETTQQASQPDAAAPPQLTQQPRMPVNAPAGAAGGGLATPGGGVTPVKQQPLVIPTMPEIPAGARWTIFCYMVKDTGDSIGRGAHIHGAIATRDALKAKTGRPDWYVIHGQDASNVYFGFYKSVDPNDKLNAAEVERANRDLDMARKLRPSDPKAKEQYPFARSLFVALDSPDPTAPPDWNLFNVDRDKNPIDGKRAFWSLQIMAFRGHQLRKEAAVQAVADLRARGVEAYYYHGETVSSVTVGHWNYDAVKEQNRTDVFKDTGGAAPMTPLVISDLPIPDELLARPIDGQRAVSVAPKLEIQNSDVLKMMQQFPTHAVNYEEGFIDKDGKERRFPCFLVEIPRAKGNGLFENMKQPAPVAGDRNIGWDRPRPLNGQPDAAGAAELKVLDCQLPIANCRLKRTPQNRFLNWQSAIGNWQFTRQSAIGNSLMPSILIATGNPHKVKEFRQMLASDRLTWDDLTAHPDAVAVEETGDTFHANACLKAAGYAQQFNTWALADDSGLEVDAIGGKPGVHSARWAEMNDAGKGDADNNALLLRQLDAVPDDLRTGRFVCSLALSDPKGKIILSARETVEGRILREPRGANGFGYDPLFLVPGLGKTTAELPSDQKHQLSHRGKALRRLRALMLDAGLA